MRSVDRSEGQACLPFDVPPRRRPPDDQRPEPARRPAEPDPLRIRLRTDALASRGWPASTELLVEPAARRPRRGDVVLAREGGRLKVGVLDLQLGRRVLRSDHGSVWLGGAAEVLGMVTVAAVPLAGMPEMPPSG